MLLFWFWKMNNNHSSIPGIQIDNKDDKIFVCRIETLSEEFKIMIREKLRSVCYGAQMMSLRDYKQTLKSFFERYDKKSPEQKTGMIGELLANLLIAQYLNNLSLASIFFNKEEANVKKGFDLIFFDEESNEHWYGEVKSGHVKAAETSIIKNKQLVNHAKSDIYKKLESTEERLWETALIDVKLTQPDEIITCLSLLLNNDSPSLRRKKIKSRVLLVGVLFNKLIDKTDSTEIEPVLDSIITEDIFLSTIIFTIHKETYTKLETFLSNEKSISEK